MASKIKKGDRVIVLTGKDKGRQGSVSKVFPKDSKVLVDGVNMVQRHTKPTRVGFRIDGDKKVRVAKTTGEVING